MGHAKDKIQIFQHIEPVGFGGFHQAVRIGGGSCSIITGYELNVALYNKMQQSQNDYRKWLIAQPPEEIRDNAYQYSTRRDILTALQCEELTAARCKALHRSPCPLEDIYKDWVKQDDMHYMGDLSDTINARADTFIRMEKKKAKREER